MDELRTCLKINFLSVELIIDRHDWNLLLSVQLIIN